MSDGHKSLITEDLIVMVGLPRSGKTTWARKQGYPIVNPDSIRLAFHGQRYLAMAEPFVWAIADLMVRALFLAGHWTVIVDGCHVKQSYRDSWKNESPLVGWTTRFMHIDTSKEVCRKRAEDEGDHEIIPIIDKMAAEFEPLAGDEVYYPVQ